MSLFVVAVYNESRQYGGPEEGGWYYTDGELVSVLESFHDEDAAWEFARNWNDAERASEDRQGWRWNNDGDRATVVELGRTEVKAEYQDYVCHGDADLWDEDGNVMPEYAVVRWDIPTYYPERRPHYC